MNNLNQKKRLLIITQKMSQSDPVLGFFHRWVSELAGRFESIIVVCLEKGESNLPANVRVISLGKESGHSRLKYVGNFFRTILAERKHYDSVFVHMNQEYLLLGGWLWKIVGKKITMWRTHHSGNLLTDLAAAFCTQVQCTSKYSYTAKYKKTILMPVGIDTKLFIKMPSTAKVPGSILFLARIAPVKKPDLLLQALGQLARQGQNFSATIVGNALPKDQAYFDSLKTLVKQEGLENQVRFQAGVANDQTRQLYNSHEIFVNLSSSGMYDKTIFEAMACEVLSLASNRNLEGLIEPAFMFREENVADLSDKLAHLLGLSIKEKAQKGRELREVVVKNHSLEMLVNKLTTVLS